MLNDITEQKTPLIQFIMLVDDVGVIRVDLENDGYSFKENL